MDDDGWLEAALHLEESVAQREPPTAAPLSSGAAAFQKLLNAHKASAAVSPNENLPERQTQFPSVSVRPLAPPQVLLPPPEPPREPRVEAQWIYPKSAKYPERSYQLNMVACCLRDNTLVCLPTGLGKTFVAAVVMYNFYVWHPQHKMVFLAPTKPLVAQQVEACYNVMGIPYEEISEMTGSTNPARRVQEWREKRCFFVTPQVLVNDISRGVLDPASIRCLIVDEAHRATGNYAYVQAVRGILSRNKKFRIVGLTATPASTAVGVQAVIENLLITKLQVRSDDAMDIQRYVHTKTVEKIAVKMPQSIVRISTAIGNEMHKQLSFLVSQNAYFTTDPEKAPMYGLMQAQQAWTAQNQAAVAASNGVQGNKMSGMIYTAFSKARILAQMRQLLMVHGLVPFIQFCEEKKDDKTNKKTLKAFINSAEFGQMYGLAQRAVRDGQEHPKLSVLKELLETHFQNAPDSRVIIFTSLRDSVGAICESVAGLKQVNVSRFVGQSGKGQKQSEQLEVVAKFRRGEFNTLVATCVGEEGLDVGECDLIILYDSSASPIRTMQRMGRTGRKRQGRCVVLVAEGNEERTYDASKNRGNNLLRSLMNKKDTYRFHVPDEADVAGLVPGRINQPTYRDAVPPPIPMAQARARRRQESRPPRAGQASHKSSQERTEFLLDFGITEHDLEFRWPAQDWLDSIVRESFVEAVTLDRVYDVRHSLRTGFMREIFRFAEDDIPHTTEYGGVDLGALAAAAPRRVTSTPVVPSSPPKRRKLPRAKDYLDDDDDNDDDAAAADFEDEHGGGSRYGASMSDSDSVDFGMFLSDASAVQTSAKKPHRAKKKRSVVLNVDAADGSHGDQDDRDDDLYEPSMVWFESSPDIVRPEMNDNDNDGIYDSSNLWFHEDLEPVPVLQEKQTSTPPASVDGAGGPRIHDAPSNVALAQEAASPDLVTPASAPTSPFVVPAAVPSMVADDAGVFKPPTSASRPVRRVGRLIREGEGILDVGAISPRMRRHLLALADRQQSSGLFFPSPPTLHFNFTSTTIECPLCHMPFPSPVGLGLHCFSRHWPAHNSDAPNYNPAPNRPSGSVSSVSSLSSSAAAPVVANDKSPAFTASNKSSLSVCDELPAPVLSLSERSMRPRTPFDQDDHGDGDGSSYEVDRILDEKVEHGIHFFHVRWKGFNTQHQTWEPEANLLPNCRNLLREFRSRKQELAVEPVPGGTVEIRQKKKKRRSSKAKPAVLKFFDLEANVSGSEGSSDEDDDDEEGSLASWVVEDDEDIIYSGTPPSQPVDQDVGFYRQAFASLSPSQEGYLVSRPKSKKTKAKKKGNGQQQKRLLKKRVVEESDGMDDVVLISADECGKSVSVANPVSRCVVCASLCSEKDTMCKVCASSMVGAVTAPMVAPPSLPSPKCVASSRELVSGLVSGVSVRGTDVVCTMIPEFDCDYIVSRDVSIMVWHEKALKNGAQILEEVTGALERNTRVVGIVEWTDLGRKTGQYERIVCQLAVIPRLQLLFSSGADHSAFLLNSIFLEASDRFRVTVDWLEARKKEIQFLSSFHFVGVSRAMTLLQHFGQVKKIVNASAVEISEALGMQVPMVRCETIVKQFQGISR